MRADDALALEFLGLGLVYRTRIEAGSGVSAITSMGVQLEASIGLLDSLGRGGGITVQCAQDPASSTYRAGLPQVVDGTAPVHLIARPTEYLDAASTVMVFDGELAPGRYLVGTECITVVDLDEEITFADDRPSAWAYNVVRGELGSEAQDYPGVLRYPTDADPSATLPAGEFYQESRCGWHILEPVYPDGAPPDLTGWPVVIYRRTDGGTPVVIYRGQVRHVTTSGAGLSLVLASHREAVMRRRWRRFDGVGQEALYLGATGEFISAGSFGIWTPGFLLVPLEQSTRLVGFPRSIVPAALLAPGRMVLIRSDDSEVGVVCEIVDADVELDDVPPFVGGDVDVDEWVFCVLRSTSSDRVAAPMAILWGDALAGVIPRGQDSGPAWRGGDWWPSGVPIEPITLTSPRVLLLPLAGEIAGVGDRDPWPSFLGYLPRLVEILNRPDDPVLAYIRAPHAGRTNAEVVDAELGALAYAITSDDAGSASLLDWTLNIDQTPTAVPAAALTEPTALEIGASTRVSSVTISDRESRVRIVGRMPAQAEQGVTPTRDVDAVLGARVEVLRRWLGILARYSTAVPLATISVRATEDGASLARPGTVIELTDPACPSADGGRGVVDLRGVVLSRREEVASRRVTYTALMVGWRRGGYVPTWGPAVRITDDETTAAGPLAVVPLDLGWDAFAQVARAIVLSPSPGAPGWYVHPDGSTLTPITITGASIGASTWSVASASPIDYEDGGWLTLRDWDDMTTRARFAQAWIGEGVAWL
jgi:hypothetical protein